MASIFTYDPNPPRVASPWSTTGSNTPKLDIATVRSRSVSDQGLAELMSPQILSLDDVGITKLEAEPQEGPTEYKLHLLLRPRTSAASAAGASASFSYNDSRSGLRKVSPQLGSTPKVLRPAVPPSSLTRQHRLQHLTTQLLWRLQQSSPFHSSSSANLVLPVLPEATPTLGFLMKPAHLLPGLEESQGALYEIGVADDGTFIGLNEDEMEESLTNLRAMAASLGCVVEVLRKVLVAVFETPSEPALTDSNSQQESLWVAEALVRPDLGRPNDMGNLENNEAGSNDGSHKERTKDIRQSEAEQIRVSLIGSTTSGKSTLLGVLTTSFLDNGRGKSRLSLLKHRHEVSSGITSSVAQELVGYRTAANNAGPFNSKSGKKADVINYGLSNVVSWTDVHSMTAGGRLAFLSDSPGLPKFSKSTIRTLISWKPHWSVFCVSSNEDASTSSTIPMPGGLGVSPNAPSSISAFSSELSLSYLALCLKLGTPMIVAITKLDLASKSGLRLMLGKVLSLLKLAGRKPVILPSSTSTTPSTVSPATRPILIENVKSLPALQIIDGGDERDISNVVDAVKKNRVVVPIVLMSSVTGTGVGKLHALLRALPLFPQDVPTPQTFPRPESFRDPNTLFHVDEVFAMPASKVYHPQRNVSSSDQGIVLCGYIRKGAISVGDELILGPLDASSDPAMHQRPDDADTDEKLSKVALSTNLVESNWTPVKVISIRNLRLPVRRLLEGQVGTMGIAPGPTSSPVRSGQTSAYNLVHSRRGMILREKAAANLPPVRSTFTAQFSLQDFEDPASPPLIIGGQALVYINSIRAPVKVTAVERIHDYDDSTSLASSVTETELREMYSAGPSSEVHEEGLFGFDEEVRDRLPPVDPEDDNSVHQVQVKITFAFLRCSESFQTGDQVLVIPSTSPSLGGNLGIPASSGASSLEKTSSNELPSVMGFSTAGLNGFVGTVV